MTNSHMNGSPEVPHQDMLAMGMPQALEVQVTGTYLQHVRHLKALVAHRLVGAQNAQVSSVAELASGSEG